MHPLREIIPTTEDWERATDYPLIPGAIYSKPNRQLISVWDTIQILDVTHDTVTMRNTRAGCGAIRVTHGAAYEILEGYTVHPLGDFPRATLPT